MSWVANVMVVADDEDTDNVLALSLWLETDAPWNGPSVPPGATGVGFLRCITELGHNQWGGWKHPECNVWTGTLNHADLDALHRRVLDTPWKQPNAVQLFLMDQGEWYFRLWMLRDGELRQYAPTVPAEDDETFLQW
jgi:hypothetical protein